MDVEPRAYDDDDDDLRCVRTEEHFVRLPVDLKAMQKTSARSNVAK